MALGPGKYDDCCTIVRESTKADGVLLIVINGEAGSGFSCQGPLQVQLALPEILEAIARQIRDDMRSNA